MTSCWKEGEEEREDGERIRSRSRTEKRTRGSMGKMMTKKRRNRKHRKQRKRNMTRRARRRRRKEEEGEDVVEEKGKYDGNCCNILHSQF